MYQAAVFHIEEFGLELEKDGRTMILTDPKRGAVFTTRLPLFGDRRAAIVSLVNMHVTQTINQEDCESLLRDLEELRNG